MTSSFAIRFAGPEDAEAIARMLADLAETMGDGAKFASTPNIIHRYGFSADALFLVLIADGSGLSLFFRIFRPHADDRASMCRTCGSTPLREDKISTRDCSLLLRHMLSVVS